MNCDWGYNGETDKYTTACGHEVQMLPDWPDYTADYEFCPFCGKLLTDIVNISKAMK